MLKNHTPLCILLSFCTAEYLVSITINGMRGQPITLHLLICLFYLLQLNIISLISPKITLVLLFITCLQQKWNFVFTLRKLVRPKPEQPDRFRRPWHIYFDVLIYSQLAMKPSHVIYNLIKLLRWHNKPQRIAKMFSQQAI